MMSWLIMSPLLDLIHLPFHPSPPQNAFCLPPRKPSLHLLPAPPWLKANLFHPSGGGSSLVLPRLVLASTASQPTQIGANVPYGMFAAVGSREPDLAQSTVWIVSCDFFFFLSLFFSEKQNKKTEYFLLIPPLRAHFFISFCPYFFLPLFFLTRTDAVT